ncbi:hypothetical protein Q4E40_03925 [Pontibacter sp. BT731]|uniref:hypothetical protein n=1 Tax=Pontibacter coccineus TaxID=3063328 RepID=UPI0026E45659|nr:hypothetical protein [Pontibacter sp. BT731]MDO6389262.1 hypothetical protein [Pontibacter sp. BT731]
MELNQEYTQAANDLLSMYLMNGKDTAVLIAGLRELERKAGKELWFRFFDGDTGATTISDMEGYFASPAYPNFKSINESIRLALKSGQLEVYAD